MSAVLTEEELVERLATDVNFTRRFNEFPDLAEVPDVYRAKHRISSLEGGHYNLDDVREEYAQGLTNHAITSLGEIVCEVASDLVNLIPGFQCRNMTEADDDLLLRAAAALAQLMRVLGDMAEATGTWEPERRGENEKELA